MTILLFILGLISLVLGAELLVRGASKLAAVVGISPLVIGLTVVAYGTSAPELAVSINAGFSGQSGIALGNVIGSNIFNVLFVLGVSAIITPLVVNSQLVRVDVPILIAMSGLLWLMLLDRKLGLADALVLCTASAGYTVLAIYLGRREGNQVNAESAGAGVPKSGAKMLALQGLYMLVGLGLLVLGAHWLVESAVDMAEALGVDDVVIGLTIIAAGTSLPEVATSVMAAIRGQRDIAVGNVVGSSIFNIVVILGVAGLVTPGGLDAAPSLLALDLPFMTAVAVACFPIFFTGHAIERWEGGVFFGYYLAYTAYLILRATEHEALPLFNAVMLAFVIPITVLTLAVALYRAVAARATARA